MAIRKAVITAARPGQNTLPLQSLVDQYGDDRTALQLILREATEAGIREIAVIVCPGDAPSFERAAGEYAKSLTFLEQDRPRGYGDALYRARDFVGGESFLHMVGDHLYVSRTDTSCARQLVQLAEAEACAISAVQPTREQKLSLFGVVSGRSVANRSGLYEVTTIVEKPTPTQAEQELVVAGLRASHYLCLFGMHVLTPTVFELLQEQVEDESQERVELSPALSQLANRERYLASQIVGDRFNIGQKYGLLMCQLAIALAGKDRDNILTEILELLAMKLPSESTS